MIIIINFIFPSQSQSDIITPKYQTSYVSQRSDAVVNSNSTFNLGGTGGLPDPGKIENSEWQVGMRIPPEPELMEQLQVSRNTLREAIRALTYAGLLKTRQGDGTYVCSSSVLGSVIKK